MRTIRRLGSSTSVRALRSPRCQLASCRKEASSAARSKSNTGAATCRGWRWGLPPVSPDGRSRDEDALLTCVLLPPYCSLRQFERLECDPVALRSGVEPRDLLGQPAQS